MRHSLTYQISLITEIYRNLTTSYGVVETCKSDHEKDSGVFASIKEMHCVSTVPEVPKTLSKPQPWREALNQGYDYFALPFPVLTL